MKSDLESQCTAIIKTFERPHKLLSLVRSIRQFYPKLPIVIVDDSKQFLEMDWDQKTKYFHVKYDVGLSEGRNIAVRHVNTPYTLLLDDDFVFTENTKIETFLSILEKSGFDLVAGDVIDFGKTMRCYRGALKKLDKKLYLKYAPDGTLYNGWPRYDFVLNFFMARTKTLLKSPWISELKIVEHISFFWDLKENDALVTYTNKVSILHYPTLNTEMFSDEYSKMRSMRVKYYSELAYNSIGVDGFIEDNEIHYMIDLDKQRKKSQRKFRINFKSIKNKFKSKYL